MKGRNWKVIRLEEERVRRRSHRAAWISERASVKCSGLQHGNRWRVSTDRIYDWSAAKNRHTESRFSPTCSKRPCKKKKAERAVKRKRNITWTLVLHLQLLLINFMINRLIVKSITGSLFRVTSSNSSFRPTNSREESLFNFHKWRRKAGNVRSWNNV